MKNYKLINDDCVHAMKQMAENSIDSIVTDPPYELGFMGKSWDASGIAYNVEMWAEALRILKPGGHLLAFGGSRTYHRLAVAIEDVGFQIRDSIAWIYGSGFPKSLDVSKAIDKNNGEVGRKFKFTKWMCTTGLTAKIINEATQTEMGNHYLTDKSQPAIPTPELWQVIRPLCGEVPVWVDELVARIAAEREVVGKAAWSNSAAHSVPGEDHTNRVHLDITAPSTPAAQQWQGWGTALKPAIEPIVVARKPLIGTVAENVLTWGVGGLNIDGSRIAGSKPSVPNPELHVSEPVTYGFGTGKGRNGQMSDNTQGRWPANIILDEVTAALVDEQSGTSKSPKPYVAEDYKETSMFGVGGVNHAKEFGDTGGASRFFYVAKASKRDRNEGLEDLEAGYSERDNGFSDKISDTKTPRQNFHPTVKPTQLMRYLVRLVTPPDGTVLDPFMGSGSTGKAAMLESFNFIGIEQSAEYMTICEKRIEHAKQHVESEPEQQNLF